MAEVPAKRGVTITTHAMWRLRVSRELPRHLISAAAVVGLAASARFAIAPPRPVSPSSSRPAPAPADRGAEGYAALFARRFLTWDASRPEASTGALGTFVGGSMQDAGLTLPSTGSQHVQWAEVVQAREAVPGRHVYTVAVQTDTAGLLYLTVPVDRASDGSLQLTGYPAFVGAPAAQSPATAAAGHEVVDQALATVLERAMRNYLAGAAGDLAADLSPAARVSLPTLALTLESVARMDWSADHRSVRVLVEAQDVRGVQYTLAYELDVVRTQGRWEVAAVQMDPDA